MIWALIIHLTPLKTWNRIYKYWVRPRYFGFAEAFINWEDTCTFSRLVKASMRLKFFFFHVETSSQFIGKSYSFLFLFPCYPFFGTCLFLLLFLCPSERVKSEIATSICLYSSTTSSSDIPLLSKSLFSRFSHLFVGIPIDLFFFIFSFATFFFVVFFHSFSLHFHAIWFYCFQSIL